MIAINIVQVSGFDDCTDGMNCAMDIFSRMEYGLMDESGCRFVNLKY